VSRRLATKDLILMTSQRGGFFLGMIVGLLIGLALALGVALYITKVPLPFIDRVPQRTAEQDAAEAEHNKNWDPNSPLYGKNPGKPHAVPSAAADASDAASGATRLGRQPGQGRLWRQGFGLRGVQRPQPGGHPVGRSRVHRASL